MVFDAKTYRDQVLKPLSRSEAGKESIAAALRGLNNATDMGGALTALARGEIVTILGMRAGMSDNDVVQHLKGLEMLINKGRDPVSAMIRPLLAQLRTKVPESATAKFWDTLASNAKNAAQQKLSAFGSALSRHHPLGIITPEDLRKAATAYGIPASITGQELTHALADHDLRVFPFWDAPTVRINAAPLQQEFHSSYRSPVDILLLHARSRGLPSHIRVIEELSVDLGGTRQSVGVRDVAQSKALANTRSGDDTEAAKKTLNSIGTECPTDQKLQELALAWFLHRADERLRKHGYLPVALVEQLKEMGLDDLDARRIVAKASSLASSGSDLTSVKEHISSGELQSARRLFTSLTAGQAGTEKAPEVQSVSAALTEAESRKAAALAEYRSGMATEDFGVASDALGRARACDNEDPDLVRLQGLIPPPQPIHLTATYSPETGHVALAWRAGTDADLTFSVVRSEGETPSNPQAGVQIVAAGTQPSAIDKTPVIAQQVVYAVFAGRPGSYSHPATTTVTVLPPPSDIKTAATASSVTVFWRTPPRSSGVAVELVHPTNGRKSFPISSKEQLTIPELQLGERYHVALTALYAAGGRQLHSTVVTVDATPRGTVQPVADLSVKEVTLPNGKPSLRAEWTDVPGYQVDIWSLPVDARLRARQRVTQSSLADLGGTRMIGALADVGDVKTMDCSTIMDVRQLFAVTWDDDDGLVGSSTIAGSAPQPKNLHAQRHGSELVVSWLWPHGDYQMDVEWVSVDKKYGQQRMDRLRYQQEGGFRIPDSSQITEVRVSTVAPGADREFTFAPVTLQLQVAVPALSYELDLPRGLLGGRTATVGVTGTGLQDIVRLVAVLAPGPFMPARITDGQTIAELALDFGSGPVQQATFSIPKIKGPFWVRLFPSSAESISLVDPPTSTLKGR